MNGSRRLFWFSSVGRGSGSAVCRSVFVLTYFAATAVHGQSTWNNLGVGDWFNNNNWTPVGVPSATTFAAIANSGEAQAQLSGLPVVAKHLEVGANNGIGKLTVDIRALTIGSDLDIGEIVSTIATGPVTVTGNGTVTISNSAGVAIGADGAGDI